MEHWPVANDMRVELDALKHEFFARPLRVYRSNQFVEPSNVEDTIRGALVEVHFTLHHYFISSDSYNSFNGVIEQILVLQPGELPPQTVYKHKNVREGPIRMNPTLAAHQPTPTHAPVAAPITAPNAVPIASGSNTSNPVLASQHNNSQFATASSSTRPTILLTTVSERNHDESMSDNGKLEVGHTFAN